MPGKFEKPPSVPQFLFCSAVRGYRYILCLVSLLVWLTSTICLAQEPVRIGLSLGLTGRFAAISDALNKGIRLWEKDVNQSGGILGKPVHVIIKDDGSLPENAQSIYKQLIEDDQVDFLFAPYSSILTEAVLPIAETHQVPILIAGAAADKLWEKGFQNAIGIYTPASKFTIGFLELLVLKELDRIAIVYADDLFSTDLANSSRTWATRFGLDTVLFESFPKGTANLEPLAQKARQQHARVLMVCGHMNESVHMRQSLKRTGWYPEAYYASVGPTLQAFYDRFGADAEHVFSTSLWEPRANYPGAQKFAADYIHIHGESPGYQAGLAYAAGQVLQEAIRDADCLDRDKVRSALFQLDTMTIIGRFGVDATGKQIRQHVFIIQWQKGRKELVWPQEIKTAEPVFP